MTVLDVAPLEAAREQLDISLGDLWGSYFALGGSSSLAAVGRHLAGDDQMSDVQHDVLVQALNERFQDRDMNHPVAYSRP